MVFLPFEVYPVAWDDIPATVSRVPVVFKLPPRLDGAHDFDEVHVFVGSKTGAVLRNFTLFVEMHGLTHADGVSIEWNFTGVVAAAYNSLHKRYVDLPSNFMVPGTPSLFTLEEAAPDIFTRPVKQQLATHTMATTCKRCDGQNTACVRLEGWRCLKCMPAQCTSLPKEETARTSACYNHAATIFPFLQPAFQHLIQSCKVAVKYDGLPKMLRGQQAELTTLIRQFYLSEHREGWDRVVTDNSPEYQRVAFLSGKLTIIESRGDSRLGFQPPPTSEKRQRAAVCVPHLGLADYGAAVALLDNALGMPERVFWKEDCVRMGGGFRTVRLFIIASIPQENTVYITLGFK